MGGLSHVAPFLPPRAPISSFAAAAGHTTTPKDENTKDRQPKGTKQQVNINSAFPSKYLKADVDLPGDGANMTVTIKSVDMVTFGDDSSRPVVYFYETDKGLVLNKTNAGTIAKLYGPDTDDWEGKKINLFDTEIDFQGKQTLAIRVRSKAPKANSGGAESVKSKPAPASGHDPFADDDEE